MRRKLKHQFDRYTPVVRIVNNWPERQKKHSKTPIKKSKTVWTLNCCRSRSLTPFDTHVPNGFQKPKTKLVPGQNGDLWAQATMDCAILKMTGSRLRSLLLVPVALHHRVPQLPGPSASCLWGSLCNAGRNYRIIREPDEKKHTPPNYLCPCTKYTLSRGANPQR